MRATECKDSNPAIPLRPHPYTNHGIYESRRAQPTLAADTGQHDHLGTHSHHVASSSFPNPEL